MTQFATVDLPLPDSPTRPSSSPSPQLERDAVDRMHERAAARDPAADAEVLDEVAHLERSRPFVLIPAPDGSTRRGGPAGPASARESACARARRRAGSGRRTRTSSAAPASDGTRPGISRSRRRASSPSYGRGIAPSSPIVYGCCGCANSSATGASSALRPAYITSTRSAMSATTPRLCVISTIAVPSRSRMSRIRSRMPAWIVTSSAVVGSSAISSFGSQASAIAIITRCRMPPDSWCGYSSSRRSGAGIRTSSQQLDRAARAPSRRDSPRCFVSTSPICRPTLKTGLSDVIGSWKTNEICRPRTWRRRRGGSASRSTPSKMRPAADHRRLGQQPHQRHARDALAAAGLADDPEHLARRERERELVDGVHGRRRRSRSERRGRSPPAAVAVISASSGGRRCRAGRRRAR